MITFFLFPAISTAQDPLPVPGARLPELTLPAPMGPEALAALGLRDDAVDFRLSDLKADLVLVEIIGVYCPQCFKQAPGFNGLYTRMNRGKNKGRVAMFAVAAGGTEPEVESLLTSGQYQFPIVSDATYSIHKRLGEPKTPFIIICRPDGSILYTHLGVITDIDGFYSEIKSLLGKS